MATTTAKIASVLVAAVLVLSVVPAAVVLGGQGSGRAWGIVVALVILALAVALLLGRRRPPRPADLPAAAQDA
jgi:hypothetical protein